MHIGSCLWTMPRPRLRSGGSTIMKRVLTLHCSGPRRPNSPAGKGKGRIGRIYETGNFYFRPVLIPGYGQG